MDTLEIDVTDEDIIDGVKGSPYFCPVAIAVARKFHNPNTIIRVTCDRIIVGLPDQRWFSYTQPPKVRQFVALFDRGDIVKPFKFTTVRRK